MAALSSAYDTRTIAAIAVASQIKDSAGLTLVITAGEETGCEGAFHLVGLEAAAEILGKAGALVVAEPTGNEPLVGHKGAFWLKAIPMCCATLTPDHS